MAEKIIVAISGAVASTAVGKLLKLAVVEYMELRKCEKIADAARAIEKGSSNQQ
jgi:hypothetical protein